MEADMGKVKPTRLHRLPILCVERGHVAVHSFAGSGNSRGKFPLGVHRTLPSTSLTVNQSWSMAICSASRRSPAGIGKDHPIVCTARGIFGVAAQTAFQT